MPEYNEYLLVNIYYYGNEPAYLRPAECKTWTQREVDGCDFGGVRSYGVWTVE